MSVNVKTGEAAGAKYLFYGVMDSANYLIGGESATAPTAGDQDGNSMVRLRGLKSLPFAIPDRDYVTVTGDDGPLSIFSFEPSELPNGQARFGTNDMDFKALCQNTLVHSINSLTLGAIMPADKTPRDMCLIVQGQASSRDSGSLGTSMWHGYIVLKSNITPLHRDGFDEKADASQLYAFVANKSDQYPWGVAFAAANLNADEMPAVEFHSLYPMCMHRFTGDGTETDFNLDYTPATEDGENIIVTEAGVVLDYTTDFTLTASTKVIAFVAAPANGAKVEVFYGFDG